MKELRNDRAIDYKSETCIKKWEEKERNRLTEAASAEYKHMCVGKERGERGRKIV